MTTSKLHRYEGRTTTVTYDAKRCIHATECVHGLPSVFDSNAKPWVNPDGASGDELSAVVERCPSGALHVDRPGGLPEFIPAINTATPTVDGPTYLRGDLAMVATDATIMLRDTRMALCRCGTSLNKPFCDGSHRKSGFKNDGGLRAPDVTPVGGSSGPLTILLRPNGPLMCTGPLTVVGTDGRAAYAESTFLCRCGHSANKPYCDGTHKRVGFTA